MSGKVAIVLATYNGARFLAEQIESLQAQDVADWRLFVRDDGSVDPTEAILQAAATKDARITVLPGGERLGVVGNFDALLRHARQWGASYVFPCDQDDVWLPRKMSKELSLMRALEQLHGSTTPLLVHSDMTVVDDALRPVHPSFLEFQGIRHVEEDPIRVLLVQNFVTGCASLYNGALLDFALPMPRGSAVHDWWFAQCAAARGRIGFVPEVTVQYRQHAANQIGAAGAWRSLNPFRAQGRRQLVRVWTEASRAVAQAGALRDRMMEHAARPDPWMELVSEFADLAQVSLRARIATLRKHGIHRLHRLSPVALLAQLILLDLGSRLAPEA
ncbi:MAG TPA: glycosyltransferase family 2 protein [Anaeromyxobacteraceae bacterium]|nr:glycosyltransferase family 2 protein [Anaeromyxobacteraceae bacterium]